MKKYRLMRHYELLLEFDTLKEIKDYLLNVEDIKEWHNDIRKARYIERDDESLYHSFRGIMCCNEWGAIIRNEKDSIIDS